ncbi:hypothetical protein DCAR_0415501 [Daucus carota subsp. sativus]|uniref:Uncharacterized protein n=1 Tax=Daucus carota subsp. sativus TaxID=79200 RepID=A0A165WBN9_DAUCS|nr:hypothetical protein DCAR_0415501 [Daucus carota subsp. sativus]
MNIHWVPPPHGMVKVNCHGVTLQEIAANGNTSGLGVNLRRTNENMISCVAGSMRKLSPLGNQLWAVFSGMRRAFLGDSRRVIIETDNLEAFGAIKLPNANATVEISSIVQQILLLKNNPTWNCSIRFVYSRRNKVAQWRRVWLRITSQLQVSSWPPWCLVYKSQKSRMLRLRMIWMSRTVQ